MMQLLDNQQVYDQADIIKQREERVYAIEHGARDLYDVTGNINEAIYQGGENIATINKFEGQTLDNMGETNKELKKASELSSSSNKKIWCIIGFLILIVIGIIIALAFTVFK